jgi:hypothetical protein
MAVDCAGNVYLSTAGTIRVISPSGTGAGIDHGLGTSTVSNAAFGGPTTRRCSAPRLGAVSVTLKSASRAEQPGVTRLHARESCQYCQRFAAGFAAHPARV